MMKRLLALISIRKLKRMKAKPLKRHCIFPKRHKNLSDKAAKEPDGFFKKDSANGIQLFLHFSTQIWEFASTKILTERDEKLK